MSESKFASVLVDVKGLKPFTYSIPDEFNVKIGSPVIVNFGTKGLVNGFVLSFVEKPDIDISKIKPILDVIDSKFAWDDKFMQLLISTSNFYGVDINTVLKIAFPDKLFKKYSTFVTLINDNFSMCNKEDLKVLSLLSLNKSINSNTLRKKSKLTYSKYRLILQRLKKNNIIKVENIETDPKLKPKTERYLSLINEKFSDILQNSLTKRQFSVLKQMQLKNEWKVADFIKTAKTTQGMLDKLSDFIKIYDKKISRNPLKIYDNLKCEELNELNDEQKNAYDFINNKIKKGNKYPILVHGITASGKTELYFKLIQDTINNGKNVLFLAPEIAIASMLTKKTVEKFGTNDVAIWHSFISEGEKYDIRERLQNNEIKILIGARSAVFAPISNLGLVIIDEEHDNSYKQTSSMPYYNAKEVCQKLAEIHNAQLILGSATPDVCTYYNALKNNTLVEMKKRFNDVPLAPVDVVDMREEYSNKGQRIFSNYLKNAILENLENKKQAVLLMNRLGYTTSIQCKDCGEFINCPNCQIPLIYHKSEDKLKCHRCNYETQYIHQCPSCSSDNLFYSGLGIEKVYDIAKKLFPNARIERLDSEVLTTKNSHVEVLNKFEKGEIDILIATQMGAKGLDNENVTLVGIVSADNLFVFPDYRAEERGFQLITQVAGRAGRGRFGGRVIIQTFNPDFITLQNAKNQDYLSFYNNEINLRKEFDYPPFNQIISLVVASENQFRAEKAINEIFNNIKKTALKNNINIEVEQPTPCIFEKINNMYRYQILLKNFDGKKGHFFSVKLFKSIKLPDDIKIYFNPTPIDLL